MKRFQLVTLPLLSAALLLAACAAKVDNRGYVATGDIKSQVTIGQTGRDEVQTTLGSPSSKSSFGPETWYYISSRTEATAFLKPEIAKQDVTRIEFDAAGIVSSIETYDEENSQDIDIAKRTTPTEGHRLGFLEQLLGNIGRFNKPPGSEDSGPGSRSGN